jgi:hypothetical protein
MDDSYNDDVNASNRRTASKSRDASNCRDANNSWQAVILMDLTDLLLIGREKIVKVQK